MQGYDVQQSTTAYPLIFLLVSSTDHIAGLTGATVTVTLSKSGGAFASPAGAVSEIANGWYKVAGNATDTATLGPLALHATASGADPTDALYPVVAFNPQATSLGLTLAKTTNITGFNDIAATAVVSSGAITTSSGAVSTVTTVGTLTTYTGNTPQTGDSFARLGAPSGASIDADILTRLATSGYTTPPTAAAIGAVVAAGSVASVVGSVGSISGVTFPTGFSLLTAAAIATTVLTDTGDNTTAGSPGKILAQLGGAFTSTSSSVYSTASLANAPTGGSAPTAAQITTQIFTNLLSSTDFNTAASFGALAKANTITSVSGSVGSVTGAVASVTGNVGGNIVGSVASVTAPVTIDGTVAVPTTGNAANSLNDCLNAARAQGFGKWVLSGTTLSLYASNGTTVVHSFTLDSATAPTQRT